MRAIRWTAWLLVVLVAGITIAVLVSDDAREAVLGTPGDGPGIASVGGPFEMVDHTGETVTEADFLGKPSVYFFGFTHCPDVCPTTLYEMSTYLGELGEDADKLNVAFVTVDPQRDTPQVMSDYISPFDPRIVGLSGSPEQVEAMTKAWRVYSRRVDQEDGEYTMDHTATVFLMDANGRFVGTIAYGEADDIALGKLERLVEGSAS
ncbi:SCO family protein [Microbaculum marinum]|uniref:SCO family protein n=1 Tax=Microbaculum marinum TaxID=1764581 RepID=A0AAW9S3B9_9HYPH